MNALKKIIDSLMESQTKPRSMVPLELLEIGDLTEKLMDRLDSKIKILKVLEAQVDEKIAVLNELISRSNTFIVPTEACDEPPKIQLSEVQSLAGKGFKSDQIARILDLPSGEVELILNLVH